MTEKPRVFLTGGDHRGWALDKDLEMNRRALEGIVNFTDIEYCDVIHSVWWETLRSISDEQLDGKRVVSYVPGEPYRLLKSPNNSNAMRKVGLWISGSSEATREFHGLGINCVQIPFLVDTNVFYPIPPDDRAIRATELNWHIPRDKYLIGSFQRDSEGKNLGKPKLVKGPDIFAEIVGELDRAGYPIHVVLAGPRRFWLRSRLEELGVSYTFIGSESRADDYPENILSRGQLNVLNNLIDLYLVSSRSEGGPYALQEAAASKCKVVSSRVGMAEDLLQPECIYDNVVEAAELIGRDIEDDCFAPTVGTHFERVLAQQTPLAVSPLFAELYQNLENIPVFKSSELDRVNVSKMRPALWSRGARRLRRSFPKTIAPRLTVGMWLGFRKPPWGGGNQFMLALRKQMRKNGARVFTNRINWCDAHLLGAVQFDIEKFVADAEGKHPRVVHRVAGPIQIARGFDKEKDDLLYELNAKYASATVFQSVWSLEKTLELGYRPVNPVIINNAADPDQFNSHRRIPFSTERKIRLITTSWSPNPQKGGDVYKWLDRNLDWNRFEYTFVGNTPETFSQIRHIPPVGSKELADILRQHDIFVTATRNDVYSNALIEAQSCGLPAVYLSHGGSPEIVSHGGLSFNETEEVMVRIDQVVENYNTYQNLIAVPDLSEVAESYLTLLQDVANSEH